MNVWKKVIALIVSVIILIRFLMFQCFALPAPSGFTPNITVSSGGNGLSTSILGDILIGAGVSSDLIKDTNGNYMKDAVERFTQEYLETGQYPDTIIADDGNEYTLGEYMTYLDVKYRVEEVQYWHDYMYDLGWNFYDFVHKNEKSITPTEITDMKGAGVKVVSESSYGITEYYGEYLVLDTYTTSDGVVRVRPRVYGDGFVIHYDKKDGAYVLTSGYPKSLTEYSSYQKNGYYEITNTGLSSFLKEKDIYGDVRYSDGTQAPSLDSEVYEIGETEDGTKITLDMLNPDGTVDGKPVTPDLSKFDDDAIFDLIRDFLEASKNTYETADPDNVVNPDDVALPDISEELGSYTVPTGIITVFPFCLPFDFVRGMKSLVQKPEAPVFKAELDLTDFCGYDLGKHTIEISFEKWEPAVNVFRWFSILLFTYSLILLTGKIVKGAGA